MTLSEYCQKVNALAATFGAKTYPISAIHYYYLRGYTPVEAMRKLRNGGKEVLTVPENDV